MAVPPSTTTKRIASAESPRQTASERWVALTRQIIARRENGPLGIARTYALVAVAQYNAVIAAREAKDRGVHPSESRAAGAAAAAVLGGLYPAELTAIGAQTAADAAYFSDLPSERDADAAAGIAVGQQVAARVLARGATDGSKAVWTGTIPTGPGFWVNAPPAQPVSPLWGLVRPWVIESGDLFRPPPPPAFGSPEFTTALAEVRRYTDNRTPEQLVVAQFWAFASGPGGPMGHFGVVATDLAHEHQLTEVQAARMFATMYMAIMDASIGCWDAKFAYWYVRPFQADPLITTPVGRPNFPSYPSAHSCFSSAAVGVLRDLFPAARADLEAAVEEAGVARIYGGLHYRFDVTAGQTLGFAVARAVLASAPRGHESIPLD
jgi:membrane-associated phospholipid phosphatase